MPGATFVSSSPWPNRPFSPACGLMPHTAIRGCSMPAFTSVSCPRRMVRSTRPGSMRSTMSTSPMWVVTWITRSRGALSIIDTSSVPVSSASSSVWPGNT